MPSFWFETNLDGSPQNVHFNDVPIVIGRGQGVDFLIEHPTVSRQHGQIVHDPVRGYKLVVMSRSGMTAVDGARVDGEVLLYDGSQIHFGQCAIVFRADDAPQKWAEDGLGAVNLEDLTKNDNDGHYANIWEKIAASPEAKDPPEKSDTDPPPDTRQLAPLIPITTTLFAAAMVYLFFFMSGGSPKPNGGNVEVGASPVTLDNVSCLGEEDCVIQATQRFELGKKLLEERNVNTSNLFEGYKKMLEVKALLEQGNVNTPAELEEIDRFIAKSRDELDMTIKKHKQRYDRYSRQPNYPKQYDVIDSIKSHFPDKTTPEYKWAHEKEIELRNKEIYRR